MTLVGRAPTLAGMITTVAARHAPRLAGPTCIAGATVVAVGAFVTQAVQASTNASDQVWRYPWSSDTALALSSLWAVAQVCLLVGLVAFRRSGAAGRTRAAAIGVSAALLGTSLILVGHLASLPIRDESIHATWPQIVGGVYGAGTVLTAIGFLLAGRATLQSRIWRGWRRFTPLATGICAVALIGLQVTAALPFAVGVYALCFAALGAALMAERA
jgi:hypothetical protein